MIELALCFIGIALTGYIIFRELHALKVRLLAKLNRLERICKSRKFVLLSQPESEQPKHPQSFVFTEPTNGNKLDAPDKEKLQKIQEELNSGY